MNKNILNIFVSDTIYLSDNLQNKPFIIERLKVLYVHNVLVDTALESLFSNVNNFSRPPTYTVHYPILIENHTNHTLCGFY